MHWLGNSPCLKRSTVFCVYCVVVAYDVQLVVIAQTLCVTQACISLAAVSLVHCVSFPGRRGLQRHHLTKEVE